MDVSKEHLRHIMLYALKKRNSAAEVSKNVHVLYGRPVKFDDELLLSGFEKDNAVSVEELANKFNSSHSAVHCHLQQLGKVPKLGKWVPNDLT
ncbi:histone-lysine N-methyltransferase SETMAR-like [Octopus bimaculoides]|uniref:histone-lysine N-methyltransferase SETMAR-like n=1 Tax=Octopus bimaculoides TaxID=37653 RepID=UPI00071CBF69|nr:histone-lysine N-methyltransferase SETMAR-like [Octopus bimaculoides]|eukprot:XP_014785693.1 PREDICTED: histone-lysine N-methyltransferase SETMAR-like [Octopus bimaculoides]